MVADYKVPSRILFIFLFLIFTKHANSQTTEIKTYTRDDSLRGFLNEFRSCFDVKHYDLKIKIDVAGRSLSGQNKIQIKATRSFNIIQLDLFRNMVLDSILMGGNKLDFMRESNAFFIRFPIPVLKDDSITLSIFYHGKPLNSINPPWSGGFVWEKDSLGRDWIGVACEGTGASLWWPNKDHLSDEPDSMSISIIAPDSLMAVSNGLLKKVKTLPDHMKEWNWKVTYPINNYNVTLNLAHYGYFQDRYRNPDSNLLPLNYYVLDYNLDKARGHFKQVIGMLECFEHYLGKFPFWNDGYMLVETPYWGMEHQSCIAYGNDYENNEYGFDFIIVHESAHEYWGNSVTVKDHAELWIHESFTTYMESLYVEYFQGRKKAQQYLNDQKQMIYNVKPIQGPLKVNFNEWNDADMYYKGSWMLHSIRNTLNNDSLWFKMLKAAYQKFKYHNISTADIIAFMDGMTPYDLKPIFQQFLTKTDIPTLNIKRRTSKRGLKLSYHWSHVVRNFNMPVIIKINQKREITLYPTIKRQKILIAAGKKDRLSFDIDRFYYQVAE